MKKYYNMTKEEKRAYNAQKKWEAKGRPQMWWPSFQRGTYRKGMKI